MTGTHNAKHILEGFPIENLRSDLFQWWNHAKRHFPWRETRDPYRILVAEILLHRTRANQVVPLYELFLQRFPDVKNLAQSSPQELRKLSRQLGAEIAELRILELLYWVEFGPFPPAN